MGSAVSGKTLVWPGTKPARKKDDIKESRPGVGWGCAFWKAKVSLVFKGGPEGPSRKQGPGAERRPARGETKKGVIDKRTATSPGESRPHRVEPVVARRQRRQSKGGVTHCRASQNGALNT